MLLLLKKYFTLPHSTMH